MKKTPRCRKIETQPEWDICLAEEWIKLYKKEIAMAKGKLSSCEKDKKPEKCKKALQKIITRAEKNMDDYKKSLVKLYETKKKKDIKRKEKEAKKQAKEAAKRSK